MKKWYSIYVGRDAMDSIYLECWLLGNAGNYKKKGSIIYAALTEEQTTFLRNEGWSVRQR